MSHISIADLTDNRDLDRAAMTALAGGISFGWIRPYSPARPSSIAPMVVNQYFTLNQYIAEELQIINQTQVVNVDNSAGAVVGVDGNASNGLALPLFS